MPKPLLDGLQTVRTNTRKPLFLRPRVSIQMDCEDIANNQFDYITSYRMTLVLGAEVIFSRDDQVQNVLSVLRQQVAHDLYHDMHVEMLDLLRFLHDDDFKLAIQKAHDIMRLMQ